MCSYLLYVTRPHGVLKVEVAVRIVVEEGKLK
jgi:hypothetical protein